MLQEETEIVEILDKCRKLLQETPQLCELSPSQVQIGDFENDIWGYYGVVAYLYVKEIDSFSYDRLVSLLSEISGNGYICCYVSYILQKEHGIRMVKLFTEASKCGKNQQILPFIEDNILFESLIELEEVEDFLTAIYINKCQQSENLLSDYAKLICNKQRQEDIFRYFMESKQKIYFDFMHHFCREVYQINKETGDRMLIELLQTEQEGIEGVAVDYLDIGIYYGCQIFEQCFEKIHNWMQNIPKLREKLIPIYIVYLKKAETDDLKKDVTAELEKIVTGPIEEKNTFMRAILSREPLPGYLKEIFDGILLHPFEKNEDWLKLFCRFLSAQETMNDSEKMQYIYQCFVANKYFNDYQNFFVQVTSIIYNLKNNQMVCVDYFLRCMFTCGVENFYFALGLYKNMIATNKIGDILYERKIGVTELCLILRGLLYYYYDAKVICEISFELIRTIPETMDAEPYLVVCMNEVYENYSLTYLALAKQQVKNYGKWAEELTNRILKRNQEDTINQKVAYSKPDLQPSMERMLLLRKARLEQNAKINKFARENSFFASLFQNRVMKYGKQHAGIQYSEKNGYSYLVTPYDSRKSEKEIAHVYTDNPVMWVELRIQYLKEREKYCEANH